MQFAVGRLASGASGGNELPVPQFVQNRFPMTRGAPQLAHTFATTGITVGERGDPQSLQNRWPETNGALQLEQVGKEGVAIEAATEGFTAGVTAGGVAGGGVTADRGVVGSEIGVPQSVQN